LSTDKNGRGRNLIGLCDDWPLAANLAADCYDDTSVAVQTMMMNVAEVDDQPHRDGYAEDDDNGCWVRLGFY